MIRLGDSAAAVICIGRKIQVFEARGKRCVQVARLRDDSYSRPYRELTNTPLTIPKHKQGVIMLMS
jgi:hypothetical protein